MKKKPTTTDEYLSALPAAHKQALENVRAVIKSVAPDLEERMSSGAPFFWYGGRRAVGFGSAKLHLSFYIMHGAVLKLHRKQLAAYDTSSTVIRFTHERQLPGELIRKLVSARIAEIARQGSRPKRGRP